MAGDFGSMGARIADELIRSDLSSQINLEILSAIQHYERQRFWFNETRQNLTAVSGTATISPPSDLLEVIRLDILTTQNHPIEVIKESWRQFEAIGGADTALTSGFPTRYAFFGNQFWLFPIPDSAYTLPLSYVKQMATLSLSGDTNAWMTDGEQLIRARARQAVKINYLGDPAAMQMIDPAEGYLSPIERAAHKSLLRESAKRLSRGRLVTELGHGPRFSVLTG
jgi:hypothetical protein